MEAQKVAAKKARAGMTQVSANESLPVKYDSVRKVTGSNGAMFVHFVGNADESEVDSVVGHVARNGWGFTRESLENGDVAMAVFHKN